MERRFDSRFDEMMEQAKVTPELLRGLLPRLSLVPGAVLWRASRNPSKSSVLWSTRPA